MILALLFSECLTWTLLEFLHLHNRADTNCPFAMYFQTRGCRVLYEKTGIVIMKLSGKKKKLIDSNNSMVIKTNLMWMEETRAE